MGEGAAAAATAAVGTGRKEWIKLDSWTLNGRLGLMAARGRVRRGRKRGRRGDGNLKNNMEGIRPGVNRSKGRMMKRCHGKIGS